MLGLFLVRVRDLFPTPVRASSTAVLCLPLVGSVGAAAVPFSKVTPEGSGHLEPSLAEIPIPGFLGAPLP